MNANTPRQYTIRNIPDDVDAALRRRAQDTRKSFNQVALEALMAGLNKYIRPNRDFRDIAGGLSEEEADPIDREIRHQRQVDEGLWQ